MAVPHSVIQKIKSKEWYRHGHYRNNYLFCEYIFYCLSKQAIARTRVEFGFQNFLQIGWDCFISLEDRKNIIAALRHSFETQDDFLGFHYQNYLKDCEDTVAAARIFGQKKYSSLSNQQLRKEFDSWFMSQIRLSDWLWIMEFLNDFLDEFIREVFKDKVRNIDQFLSDVCFYEQELEFVREEKALLQLAVEVKEGTISEKSVQQQLQAHCSEFAWLNMYIYDGDPFTSEYFKKRLKEYVKNDPQQVLLRINLEKEQKQKTFNTVFPTVPEKLKPLVENTRNLLFLKSSRIDAHTKATYLALPLLEEAARRLSISRQVLVDLSYKEIVDGLEAGNANLAGFKERKKGSVLALLDGAPFRCSGADAQEVRSAIPQQDFSDKSEVTGQMAYPGKVQGRARIVETELQLDKVEQGDVLFSPMTNQNYTPVFGKVAAIITDEGGVLCHSAIISRELKIPCVMGVRIGTKVFKDGDVVEVDADKGIVRKI